MCRTDIDFLRASSRPVKRRRTRTREEEEEISGHYSSRPVKRTREEEVSRSNGFRYSSSRSGKGRREEEHNNSRSSQRIRGDSSNKHSRRRHISSKSYKDDGETNRKRRERNSGGGVINYSRSSSIERRRREDSQSSNKRRRRIEDSSSKSNRCRDDSPNSCSDQSVITQEDINNMLSLITEEDINNMLLGCKFDDVSPNSRSDGSVINIPVGSSITCDDATSDFYEDKINAETTPVGSFPCFVDDGLVTQILTRLPVKSLCRFKSVCKRWRSLITHDQHFIHLQLTRSQSRLNLLCIAPLLQQQKETLPQRIMSADLSFKTTSSAEGKVPQVIIHNVKKITDDNWFNYDTLLEPVNGLVCFIHWRTAAARIYNLGTREVTPWIKSTLLAEEKGKFESEDNPIEIVSRRVPIYQMGFDPEKKEHKVFCFWRLSARAEHITSFSSDSASSYASWEALTVGHDTKWRRIGVVPHENNSIKINEVLPPDSPERSPVYANGTIYWRNKGMSSEYDLIVPDSVLWDYAPSDPDVIIAFDVGSEKYRVIPIPGFILDEPREKMLNRPVAMLVLGGRVTLVYQMSHCTVKLWMLDDGVEKKLENCQGKGSCNWCAETITLPFVFDTRFHNLYGVPASADILLISSYGEFGGSERPKVTRLYSYDRKTKTGRVDEMDSTFSVPLNGTRSLFTTFVESLIPVQPASTRQSDAGFHDGT